MANPRKSAQTRIKKKLDALFTNVPDEKREAAALLTKRAAFLLAGEDELERIMQDDGYIDTYDNGGGQTGIRVHPAVQVYTQYHKDLTASLRQLREFMPEDVGTDELVAFMEEHKK